ncbi:vesicle-fusing ATPase 1-like [Brachionus plicatilis]|uniref:Vesicle-fusing ATPase n=1 Tax=Brachionus plicatilis TaxID=10195 RepID=A0A3M7S2B5_BRAPC|nr:vesicle-fusing ATPase 1-like [Brachionus plicatilis]
MLSNSRQVPNKQLRSVRCPSEELTLTNCAIVHPKEFESVRHVEIIEASGKFIFSIRSDNNVPPGDIGFSAVQRKWANISLESRLMIKPFSFDLRTHSISLLTVEVDFLSKKTTNLDPYDTDKLAPDLLQQFSNQAFTVGQQFVFQPSDRSKKMLIATVKSIEAIDLGSALSNQASKPNKIFSGQLLPNSSIMFEKSTESSVNLIGKNKGKMQHQSIINPDWDFTKIGIGGLDREFNTIFRRAFASRVFPPELIQQLGIKHVRGILLFGPPGTGKTLMARQIGKMLNAREPKIVNGPQILDKYVGESEANIRKLFAEAEEEEKRLGPNSGLHIIIFDEIDAICKQRGTATGSTGVHDTVVNQLLSKIDGVDQLNNILVIGMTNRRDMIDEALLRPGRLEVQLEISLPDETGRLHILQIHTAKMKEHGKLHSSVNLAELAALSKNFSGAEIEGLVRAAQSSAMNRPIKASNKVELDVDAVEKLQINRDDFMYALENDIKPAFGVSSEDFELFIRNGIVLWSEKIQEVLEEGKLRINQTIKSEMTPLVTILLEGKANSGKTALAAKIAMESEFPFMKFCSPQSMIGYSELAKAEAIKKVFNDAYKSELSCVVVDEIESLLDYAPIGPRFSNFVLQTLKILFKKLPPKGRKLLLIATTSEQELVKDLGLYQSFSKVIHVPNITRGSEVMAFVEGLGCFSNGEMSRLSNLINHKFLSIGVKSLLDTIELSNQATDALRIDKFIDALEDIGGLHD